MMHDRQKVAVLRAVLDEVCKSMPITATAVRAHVASKLLDVARQGDCSVDVLQEAARRALIEVL
jgi:hypothetical protein